MQRNIIVIEKDIQEMKDEVLGYFKMIALTQGWIKIAQRSLDFHKSYCATESLVNFCITGKFTDED